MNSSGLLKVVEWLHLWPSLISAIVLIVVCFSGTVIIFADEIISYVNQDALYVEQVQEQRLPMKASVDVPYAFERR